MSVNEDLGKSEKINQKGADGKNHSSETKYRSMAGNGSEKIEKLENARRETIEKRKTVKKSSEGGKVSYCLRRLMDGPKRDGPILEYSVYSLLYLFRDLIWMVLLFFPIFAKTLWRTFSTKPEKDIKDEVVVVTGAGSGLGKEMALQFARKGCRVACVDIKEEWNKRTETIIAYAVGDEDRVKSYTCDVSKPSDTKTLAAKILQDFGRVDILVNNAGILYGNTITGGSDAMIKRVIDVNLLSGFWMTRAFLPDMKKAKSGHIVFINSGSGVNPIANSSVYCSSKFALTGLAYAMQEEFRLDPQYENIKVTSVHPYFIKTNPEYVKNWRLRLPPLEVKDAASQIIKGIRRGYQNFSVPALDMGYWMSSSIRYLPRDLYNIFLDTFYADIAVEESSEHTKPSGGNTKP